MNLNKELVSKEGLLKYIKDVDVYRYYTGKDVSFGTNMSSPLREDTKNSFGYFVGQTGEICFNDFVLGKGDFVKFVQMKFRLNFFEALSKIVIDLNLTYHFNYKKNIRKSEINYNPQDYSSREEIISNISKLKLQKKRRDWKLYDAQFWFKFGIDLETLKQYNVEPIDYIFLDGQIITVDKYAYAFIENKDGRETYKIYQPFNEKYKWLNNHDNSIWQGWTQLPESGEKLIITKSLKDVMSIRCVMNLPAIALQSESTLPKDKIMEELKTRFDTTQIWVLYDNDFDKEENWGRNFGKKIADEHMLFQIEIPSKYRSKDFSDLVQNYGVAKSQEIFNNMITLPF